MENYVGKWLQVKQENLEEYMAAQGVGLMMRKAAAKAALNIEITEKDGGYHIHQWTSLKKMMDISFKLGEEADWARPDGKKCKTKFTIEGGKLMQISTLEDGSKEEIIREISGGQLVLTVSCKDVVCKRWFDKK